MRIVIDGELLGRDYLGPYVEPKGRAGTERELTTNSSHSSICTRCPGSKTSGLRPQATSNRDHVSFRSLEGMKFNCA